MLRIRRVFASFLHTRDWEWVHVFHHFFGGTKTYNLCSIDITLSFSHIKHSTTCSVMWNKRGIRVVLTWGHQKISPDHVYAIGSCQVAQLVAHTVSSSLNIVLPLNNIKKENKIKMKNCDTFCLIITIYHSSWIYIYKNRKLNIIETHKTQIRLQ